MQITPQCQQAIEHAHQGAVRFGHPFVSSAHLLLGLLAVGRGAAKVLGNVALTGELVESWLKTHQQPEEETQEREGVLLGRSASLALDRAELLRRLGSRGDRYVGTDHLLLALTYEARGPAQALMEARHVDLLRLRQLVVARFSEPYPAGMEALFKEIEDLLIQLENDPQ